MSPQITPTQSTPINNSPQGLTEPMVNVAGMQRVLGPVNPLRDFTVESPLWSYQLDTSDSRPFSGHYFRIPQTGEIQEYTGAIPRALSDTRFMLEARHIRHLPIPTDPPTVTNASDRTVSWTGEIVATHNLGQTKPGLFLQPGSYVQADFCVYPQAGYWPAIWLFKNGGRYFEIDLLEVFGDRDQLTMSYHQGPPEGGSVLIRQQWIRPERGLEGMWHTVGLQWEPDRLVYWLDGKNVWELVAGQVVKGKPVEIPTEPMFLQVNLAIGGHAGDPDPLADRMEFYLDNLQAWQR